MTRASIFNGCAERHFHGAWYEFAPQWPAGHKVRASPSAHAYGVAVGVEEALALLASIIALSDFRYVSALIMSELA